MGIVEDNVRRMYDESQGIYRNISTPEVIEEPKQLVWKPNKKQELFASIPDSIFEAMYGGAAFGGKSELLLNLTIMRGFHQYPRYKGIIFRRTFPELEAELIVRSQSRGFFKGVGAKYNADKKRWVFPSGAIFQFAHMEYENDVRKYDSAEYNLIIFDELTSFTEFQYTYMFSRCRSADSNLPAIVRSGTNPGNIGHAWVRERFVEPAPYGTIIYDKVTTLKRIFIQSFATDNPEGLKNSPNYIAVLSGMAEKDRRAKLDGDWYSFGGQVFGDFRDTRYEGEPKNALHTIEPFIIPEWWPRILCIDWGFNAMTYALWGAIGPDGRLYLYREYSIKQAKISEWAKEIGNLAAGETYYDIVICQSAGQNRGEDTTIQDQFKKYSKLEARLSINEAGSRVSSKIILQDLLRWKPNKVYENTENFDNEIAQYILRNEGMANYKAYLSRFAPQREETNLPIVQIFKDLVVLRKTIPLCVYDDKQIEDVAEFKDDDPYDAFRYMGRSYDRYRRVNLLKGIQENIERKDAIISELKTSNDWNSYYRKMERLEQNAKSSQIKPFQRVRRRYGR